MLDSSACCLALLQGQQDLLSGFTRRGLQLQCLQLAELVGPSAAHRRLHPKPMTAFLKALAGQPSAE